jgi:hypothetical protein
MEEKKREALALNDKQIEYNSFIVTGDPEIIGLDDAIRVEKLERYRLKRH